MSRNDLKQRREIHDPEPLVIAALIFAAVSAAADVFQIARALMARPERRQREQRNKRSLVLRWEAEVFDFSNLLEDVRGFLSSVSQSSNPNLLSRPLEPLTTAVYLDGSEMRAFKQQIQRLATAAKSLSAATLNLLPAIDDDRLREFMESSLPDMREILNRLKQMQSLDRVLADAVQGIELLKRTANYLRNEIVE